MGGAYAEGRPPGPWKEGRSLDVQTRVGGLPGGRHEQNLAFRSKQRVPGPWRESEKTDVGSVLIASMSPAYARTGHSRPCLGIALVTETEKEWPAGLPSPLPMPCKQAQPGCRPRPDRSCLALGSEVARKAGRARLSDSQGFRAGQVEGSQGGGSLRRPAQPPWRAGSCSGEQSGRKGGGVVREQGPGEC